MRNIAIVFCLLLFGVKHSYANKNIEIYSVSTLVFDHDISPSELQKTLDQYDPNFQVISERIWREERNLRVVHTMRGVTSSPLKRLEAILQKAGTPTTRSGTEQTEVEEIDVYKKNGDLAGYMLIPIVNLLSFENMEVLKSKGEVIWSLGEDERVDTKELQFDKNARLISLNKRYDHLQGQQKRDIVQKKKAMYTSTHELNQLLKKRTANEKLIALLKDASLRFAARERWDLHQRAESKLLSRQKDDKIIRSLLGAIHAQKHQELRDSRQKQSKPSSSNKTPSSSKNKRRP